MKYVYQELKILSAAALCSLILIMFCPANGFSEQINKNLNVLLFSIDSFRPDHLSCNGYNKNTTPTIDGIAKNGLVFNNAIGQSAWTTPGMLSIFTSLYPHSHKVNARGESLDPDINALPKALKAHGYSTPAFSYLIQDPNYHNLGFEPAPDHIFKGTTVEELFTLLDIYKNKTFFIWYHNKYIHLPYKVDPPYDRLLSKRDENSSSKMSSGLLAVQNKVIVKNGSVTFDEGDKQTVEELYDANLKKLDDTILRLLNKLKELNLEKNTLLIITADHGEELLDHGFVGHASTSLSAKLYDEIIHIPLIFYLPGTLNAKSFDTQVQQIDIFPTVFDILNLDIPDKLEGQSLLKLMNSKVRPWHELALSETNKGGYQSTEEMKKIIVTSLRTPEWKLICTNNQNKKQYELYNLKKDPGEKSNVHSSYPHISSTMELLINQIKAKGRN